jgi:hypothetical protein
MEDKLMAALKLGVEMRSAQRAFYASPLRPRPQGLLRNSLRLEKAFDDMAKYLLALHEARQPPSQ